MDQRIFQFAYEALLLILMLSGPPIFVSMTVGIFIAIFQAATQIQEQTLSFTIKLVATMLTLMLLGPWLGGKILHFSINIFSNFPRWY